MGIFAQYATNRKLEKEGIEVTFLPNADGSIPSITLARTFRESQDYRKVFERISKPYKAAIDNDSLDETDDLFVMARTFAEVSVKGWKNMRLPMGFAGIGLGDPESPAPAVPTGFGGTVQPCDIPFTVDNVTTLFCAMPDVFRELAAKSTNADNYRAGILDELAKN